ncbi:MAG TPA: DUF4956 domain-containing protein [Verrucomicrobiae bacterium]|jgi:uncharacterized membrane protein YhiD involved in acid resistance|nr:DUF4956 domain-containing protein [Verrucomicrobiae bacterium]
MPDFLQPAVVEEVTSQALLIGLHLVVAGVLGFFISWIYRKSRKTTEIVASFPTTLVLLCILIAMVTQVIGNNTARAFSLVGVLSIVRFRTVVRDTQDTAYVIFSVAVGMAIGAHFIWAGVVGLVVVGGAAFLLTKRGATRATDEPPFMLNLRIAIGLDLKQVLAALQPYTLGCDLISMGTAKQGACLDVTYETRLKDDRTVDDVVKALNKVEGVQNVTFQRQGFEE